MEQNQREQEIFQAALDLGTPEERRGFVRGACGEDEGLRQRVEVLLAAYFASQSYVPSGHGTLLTARKQTGTPEEVGTVLGRYKLLQKIGEGGCGVVYLAEQGEPVQRRVALKIIKLGMDTRSVIARFEAERQALARMEHANIAKVLDAGATESGRPYFVMELVRGIKITEYCDQHNLAPRERLQLFIQVCHAIQHAHQKGVIHRDIKPSNILVSLHEGSPVPVVIDFGIAKATEQPLTDMTMVTAVEQLIGTPAYMSPEQAEGSRLDIDTRSDIYSLGVLLYELLTGKTPFESSELIASGVEGMRRMIREQEPGRPSTRLARLADEELATTAKHRQLEAPKLVRLVRGDLDWIVMKCLEKDRTRRYETASALVHDLQNYLSNRPVMARPPSGTYRLQKFARRNKALVGAAGLVAAALVLGSVVSAWQATQATRARKIAVAEREVHRGLAYAADMNLAQQALWQNNLGRARGLLNQHRPKRGEKELRGWEWRYLWAGCHSDELCTLIREPSTTTALASSPDGKWVAVGGHDGKLTVLDMEKRTVAAQVSTLEDQLPWSRVCLAMSPAKPLLAFGISSSSSGNRQSSVHLWDVQSQSVTARLALGADCAGLAFSRDGQKLLVVTETGEAALFNPEDGRKLSSFRTPALLRGFPSWPLTADPGLRLAACVSGKNLLLLELETGKTLWTIASPGYFVACAFSPDGRVLATSSAYSETAIRRWDVATGRELTPLEGHRSCVFDMVFWPDGTKMASASSDQTIRIWDLGSGRTMETFCGHQDEVWRLALLPNGTNLVSGSKDGTVRLWDLNRAENEHSQTRLPARASAWCFSVDAQSVFTVDEQGNVERWHGQDFQERTALFKVPPVFRIEPFSSVRFSGDGRLLAAASANGDVQVWDLHRGAVLHEFKNRQAAVPVTFLAEDQKLSLAHSKSGTLHLCNLSNGVEETSWASVPRVSAVAFSPDQRWCFMAGYKGDSVWRDLRAGRELKSGLTFGTVESATFSPDSTLLAAADWSSVGRVWKAGTGEPVATLGRFLLGAHSAAFSPDGSRLAVTSSGSETVKLWSVESQQELLTLESRESRFVQGAFSRGGNYLGALSMEGYVHLWRAPSWEEIEAAEKAVGPFGATP